jgi:hypothetical protein
MKIELSEVPLEKIDDGSLAENRRSRQSEALGLVSSGEDSEVMKNGELMGGHGANYTKSNNSGLGGKSDDSEHKNTVRPGWVAGFITKSDKNEEFAVKAKRKSSESERDTGNNPKGLIKKGSENIHSSQREIPKLYESVVPPESIADGKNRKLREDPGIHVFESLLDEQKESTVTNDIFFESIADVDFDPT